MRILKGRLCFGVIAGLVLGGSVCIPVIAQEDTQAESATNADAFLKYLRPALRSSSEAGRVYYATTSCESIGDDAVPFPKVSARAVPAALTGVAAVRSIFPEAEIVDVDRRRKGVINVRIGKLDTSVLNAKIRRLKLTPQEQYNPQDAIAAVLNEPSVTASIKSHGLWLPAQVEDHLVVPPGTRGWPHLPAVLNNLTADEALDRVATTFNGIVFFGACSDSHIFDIAFTYSSDPIVVHE